MKTSLKIQHRRAFSLLEFIGALAILTILASIITPVVIRRLDQAARAREISDLTAISNALVLQMLKSNTISSASTWATDAATWTLLPVSAISQNPRHYNRVLFIDTNGWLGTVSLPFTQGIGGTTNAPAQARMVIVSCLSGTNGVSQSSGSLAASLFNDLWNTPQGYKPNTWTNWRGNTEDVFVQRLNLQPLFHRVMLFNQTGSTNSCAYAINGSSTAIVTNELNSYYLDGTILGLYTNGGATATLQTSETVNRDLSRLFQGQGSPWSDQPGPGPGTSSMQTGMDNIAYAFINSQSAPPTGSGNNFRGDNTFGIVDVMISYMSAYSSWATMPTNCFYTEGVSQGNVQKIPEYILMCNAIGCFGGGCGSGNGNAACTIVP